MPVRKISTLKQLCIDRINHTLLYPTHWLHDLPPALLEELILYPNNRNQSLEVSPPYKWRLIRKEITRLEIEFQKDWKPSSSVKILNAALNICQNLTHLTLKNTDLISTSKSTTNDFINFVRYIPNIVVLNMTNSCFVDDDILEAIGDNCPKLESLHLKSDDVSDNGIRRFCQSKSRGSNLKYLCIDHSKITVEGVLIALHNLKQLREFNNDRVIEAFREIFRMLDEAQELPTFQLCKLPIIYIPIKQDGFLQFLMKCCPNVVDFELSISDIFFNNGSEIRKCDKITSFSLVFLRDSLIPHWSNVGSKLTCLTVIGCNIDLKLLGLSCPNLQELILAETRKVSVEPFTNAEIKRKKIIPFSKLLKLWLYSIPNPAFNFLLQNCLNLEGLHIGGTKQSDDVVISTLREVNPLKCLTQFSIYNCKKLTKKTIFELLTMENNLECLQIEDCKKFNDCDMIEIQSYIKKNNFHVEFKT